MKILCNLHFVCGFYDKIGVIFMDKLKLHLFFHLIKEEKY